MFRLITLVVLCVFLIGCGAPSATPQPMQAAAPWTEMVVVELTGFAPLKNLDIGGTGEVLLVGLLQDATGQMIICSDDNARAIDIENVPIHVPLDVTYNQSIGLKCNGAGRLQADEQVALAFVAFELDDLGIVTEVVDLVLDAFAVIAIAEPTPAAEVPVLIAALISRALTSSSLLEMVEVMGVYYKRVGQNEDYAQRGDLASNEAFRLHYHTSPILNQTTQPPVAPRVQPKPEDELRELLQTLLPHHYFVCNRKAGQKSCREKGGLHLRDTPCAMNNEWKKHGGNIISFEPNGTYVQRIREEFVSSECSNDGVTFWMYVQTEDGKQGYMSASLTYLNADFLRE